MNRTRRLFVSIAVLIIVVVALAWHFCPVASAQGNKSDVIVQKDAPGSLQIVPKQCYETGTALSAVRWTICPKFLQDSDAKNLYILVSLTEKTTGLFPSFTQASVDFNVDGAHFTTGDVNWDSETLGRVAHVYTKYLHIPVSRNYLESLTTAHDIAVSVQLTGKSTRSDMHIDGKDLQKFQSGCKALLTLVGSEPSVTGSEILEYRQRMRLAPDPIARALGIPLDEFRKLEASIDPWPQKKLRSFRS